eukprot:IDg3040t1
MENIERQRRVQQFSQLVGVVLGLIPFAGVATASAVAGAVSVWEGMEMTNVVESLLGAGIGALEAGLLHSRNYLHNIHPTCPDHRHDEDLEDTGNHEARQRLLKWPTNCSL